MAKPVGFLFTVGAKMASSVSTVFDTVAGRAGKLKTDLKQLKGLSSAAGKVTNAEARIAELKTQEAAGKNVAKELQAAGKAFASAQRSAKKYNISVADAAKLHAQATAQITKTENALKRQETTLRNRAKRQELKGEIMGTIASVGMVTAPVKIALDFESAMADAAKTIDGMRDDSGNLTAEYYAMENAVKKLGRELPLTHEQLAGLFAAGGQMGYSTADELTKFTELAAHMSVAFGMGTEDAAAAIGGYRAALNLSFDDTREMLDLMNMFANTSSATEQSIAAIVSQVGPLGKTAGVSHKPMAALAATLASMKIDDSVAGTGIKNFLLALTTATGDKKRSGALASIGIDAKGLAQQMQVDAEGAMIAVLERLQKLPEHLQIQTMKQLFGRESLGAISPLLTQLDLLKANFGKAGDQTKYAGAMQQEFENRAKTTANNLILAKNRAAELAITMGGVLLPTINDALGVFGAGVSAISEFAVAHPTVTRVIMGTVTALAGFKVASLAGRYSFTLFSDALNSARGMYAAVTAVTNAATFATVRQKTASMASAVASRAMAVAQGAVTAAQWALNAALTANPIGLVIAGVAALGAGLVYLYNTCEPVRAAFDWLWSGVKSAFGPVATLLETAWNKVDYILAGIRKVKSWFSSDEPEKAEEKIDGRMVKPAAGQDITPVAVSGAAVSSASPRPAPPPPPPSGIPLPAARSASGPAPSGPITVTQQITVSAEIKELRKEVLDALKNSGPELEKILGALLKDKARVSYG